MAAPSAQQQQSQQHYSQQHQQQQQQQQQAQGQVFYGYASVSPIGPQPGFQNPGGPYVIYTPQGSGQYMMFPGGSPFEDFNSHLLISVVSILFFWPLGIIATVKSFQAQKRWRHGDLEGGLRDAATAWNFAMAAVFIGLSSWFLGVILHFVMVTWYFKEVDKYVNTSSR